MCASTFHWVCLFISGMIIALCLYIYTHRIFSFISFWLCAGSSLLRGLFSSCGKQGLLSVAVHRLLIVVASLIVEHSL